MPIECPGPIVIKVGGSLYDWPELGPRLRAWLQSLATDRVLIVPGGGGFAEVVRQLDRVHRIGEEMSHWLALQTLSIAAQFVASLLRPLASIIVSPGDAATAWRNGHIPILDTYSFANQKPDPFQGLPHTWAITSDTLSARISGLVDASELVLLKSIDMTVEMTWDDAARDRLVDPFFPRMLSETGNHDRRLPARWVNLRTWTS